MISVKIKQSDLNDLNRKLNQLKSFSKDELSKQIGDTAAFSAARMQKSVPRDKAALIQGIGYGRMGKMARVFSKVFYSPFIEFGTRDGNMKFDDMLELGIPKSYAEQFKANPLKKKTNLNARPFFFSSLRVELKSLMDRLERRLNNLTR